MSDLSESEKFILLKWLSMSISDKETMECLDDHWLWDAILTAEANSKLAKKELLRLYVRTGELPQQAAKEVFAKDTENWVQWCGERMYQKFGITRNDQLFWLKFKINRPKVKFVLEGDGQWSGSEEQEEKIGNYILDKRGIMIPHNSGQAGAAGEHKGRGVWVPSGQDASVIMEGAEVLQRDFDVPPYTARSMIRCLLAVIQERQRTSDSA